MTNLSSSELCPSSMGPYTTFDDRIEPGMRCGHHLDEPLLGWLEVRFPRVAAELPAEWRELSLIRRGVTQPGDAATDRKDCEAGEEDDNDENDGTVDVSPTRGLRRIKRT